MSVRSYRRLRIAVGAVVLLACTVVFADVRDWFEAPAARWLLWPQFGPSVLGFLTDPGWVAAGFLVVLGMTLLLGRVYCAMLCPLGVLMDFSAWLGRRTGARRRLSYRRGRTWLRVAVVAAAVVAVAGGSAWAAGLLEPFSLFGRIVSGTLRPLAGWANNAAALAGWTMPVEVSPVPWTVLGLALGMLGLVVVLALIRGRLWCNTLCPVGAVLGAVSKFSIYRLQIDGSECTACSMCERVCPAQCIDFRNHRIEHSRCVMCLDCVRSCRRSGITLERAVASASGRPRGRLLSAGVGGEYPGGGPGARATVLPSVTRRLLLRGALLLPAAALAGKGDGNRRRRGWGGGRGQGGGGRGRRKGSHSGTCDRDLDQFSKRPSLPPGAISLEHFRSHCTACHLCVSNCPEQVLRPSVTKWGLAGFLQPYQDFDHAFCAYECADCSQVCPTGAIQPLTVDERKGVQTGVAEFFKGRCVVKTQGTACGACAEHCPTAAIQMVPWQNGLTIPEVDPDLCVGCGGCEFICPVTPQKAIVVHGHREHTAARRPLLGRENTVREIKEEFPF